MINEFQYFQPLDKPPNAEEILEGENDPLGNKYTEFAKNYDLNVLARNKVHNIKKSRICLDLRNERAVWFFIQ